MAFQAFCLRLVRCFLSFIFFVPLSWSLLGPLVRALFLLEPFLSCFLLFCVILCLVLRLVLLPCWLALSLFVSHCPLVAFYSSLSSLSLSSFSSLPFLSLLPLLLVRSCPSYKKIKLRSFYNHLSLPTLLFLYSSFSPLIMLSSPLVEIFPSTIFSPKYMATPLSPPNYKFSPLVYHTLWGSPHLIPLTQMLL